MASMLHNLQIPHGSRKRKSEGEGETLPDTEHQALVELKDKNPVPAQAGLSAWA